jgi:hypothetical protein
LLFRRAGQYQFCSRIKGQIRFSIDSESRFSLVFSRLRLQRLTFLILCYCQPETSRLIPENVI